MADTAQNSGTNRYGSKRSILGGSCECQACRFVVRGKISDITACHCTECRKASGMFTATFEIKPKQIEFEDNSTLRWFQSTDVARRAFCGTCGTSILWELQETKVYHVYAGVIDEDLPVRLVRHQFVREKPTFYDIDDGLPQAEHLTFPNT